MKRKRYILKIIAIAAVFAVTLIPIVSIAVWQVLHGRGAAVYTNVYGLTIHYTSALILVAALATTLAVAFIARLVYFWRNEHDSSAVIRKLDALTQSGNLDANK